MDLIVLRSLVIFVLAYATAALAQTPSAVLPPENPLSAHTRKLYGGVQVILVRSAEAMPQESYGFKPTEAVRSFGQLIGHIADSQYLFCSAALGEKNPSPKVEKSVSSKLELIAALKGAFAYCDSAYNGLTDLTASQTVKFMGGDSPKLGVLHVNQVHTIEHYGNIVTYLRMKNLVPPTSDPVLMQQLRK